MLPSLSIEFRLPVGVARCCKAFFSATRAVALWIEPWEPELELASRLAKDLSGCFFDLKRKAMVMKKQPLDGGGVSEKATA